MRDALAALRTKRADRPGLTGKRLIEETLRRLEKYPKDYLDCILVVDDADCRFCADHRAGISAFQDEVETAVQRVLGRALPVFVLLASPEIEAWFLEDLNSTFASRAYGRVHWNTPLSAQQLNGHLAESGIVRPGFFGNQNQAFARLSPDQGP